MGDLVENLERGNRLTGVFAEHIAKPKAAEKGKRLYTGIDLGTAYIVLAVVDEDLNPIAGGMEFAEVVRDGLVVDYAGAVAIVKRLKQRLETAIGAELELAGVAYPPGTNPSDCRAIHYVAEAAGFRVAYATDEPTAANHVLGIQNGAVADIGGGTTGIAVFSEGKVIDVQDEPSGGTHLSLVIAGAKGIPFLEAEKLKKDGGRHQELLPIVRPVMEKVAGIIGNSIAAYPVDTVYLVGGTCCFHGIETVVGKELICRWQSRIIRCWSRLSALRWARLCPSGKMVKRMCCA